MLENFVVQEDIPLIRSLVINQSLHRDTYCWSFTKNGIYTVKLEYCMARHILKVEEDVVYTKPSIAKLQTFAWKLNAPQNICHLLWQLITGHVAVTRNLIRRHM